MHKTLLYLFVIGTIGLAGCESDEPQCYEPQHVTANIRFEIDKDTMVVIDSSNPNIPPITKDTIYIYDTALNFPIATALVETGNYSTQYDRYNLYLFLNPDTNFISYKIQVDSAMTDSMLDTLTLYYRPSLHFISNACGYTYYYTIDSLRCSKHVFDTAYISEQSVTSEASKVNVHLGFIRQ